MKEPIFVLLAGLLAASPLKAQKPKDEFEKYGPFGSDTYKDLKTALALERNVYKLDLSYQKIDPKQYEKMNRLVDLQALRLRANELTEYPKNFEALYNLSYFATYLNKFNGFPPEMKSFLNLNYLEFQHTNIDSIPARIAYCSKLKTFKFGNTEDTLALPITLGFLKNLENVSIENCVMDSFPKHIYKIPNLVYLNLSNTNTHYITRHFERFKKLEVLVIENNPISKIPFDIYKAQKLRVISLRGNKIEKLPDSISQLEELSILDLTGNPMSQDEIDKLKVLLPGCEIRF